MIGLFSETSLAEVRDVHAYHRELGEQIVLGDRLGYDFFSMTQSYGLDWPDTTFSVCPDPSILFAAQIARTERIKLLPAIHIAPFQHPAMALSHAAAVDVASGGRMMIGIGRGHPWLYTRLGFDQSESAGRLEEFCDVTRRILEKPDGRHSYDGKFWTLRDFELVPQFIRRETPVYVAQVGGKPSADIAVKHGFGMIVPSYLGIPMDQVEDITAYFRKSFAARWDRRGDVLIGVHVFADPDKDKAIEIGARALARQLHVFARNMIAFSGSFGKAYAHYRPIGEVFQALSDIDVCRRTVLSEWPRYLAVWGDGAMCLEKLQTIVDRLTPTGLILNIDAGGIEFTQIKSAMTYLAQSVVPALRPRIAAQRAAA